MIGITVTLMSAAVTGQDDYGRDIYELTSQQISGAAFVPGATSEATEGTEQVIADAEIYLPPGTVVNPEDQIIVNGTTYQVTGRSSAWQSPYTQIQSPVMARLRIVTGAAAHSAVTGGDA
jgi:hypothetical protein